MLSKKKLSPWFLLALLLVLGWVSFRVVGVFIDYVLTGLFVAYITHPLYRRLDAKLKLHSLSAMTMVLGVAVVVFLPLGFLLVELLGELRSIVRVLDPVTFTAQIEATTDRILEILGQPPSEGGNDLGIVELVASTLDQFASRFASNLIGVIAEGFIGTFVMLYILFYAYADGDKFVQNLREILPLQEPHRDLLFHEVGNVIEAVMFGTVLTAIIQAVLGGIGFAIFGVPNVVFWSAIMFILALLPIVGPPIIWGPWGIGLIASGHTFAGIGLLIYSAIMVSSLDNIIRPKLIGDRAHIHPTVVLLGVLGGVVVFGFSGLILGPLVLSIFVTILQVYRKEFMGPLDDGVGA